VSLKSEYWESDAWQAGDVQCVIQTNSTSYRKGQGLDKHEKNGNCDGRLFCFFDLFHTLRELK
jgi:hypothetical protein